MKAQIEVPEGSAIKNLTVPSGTVFPTEATTGELFYLTSGEVNLYVYRSTSWVGLIRDNMVIEFVNATANPNSVAVRTIFDSVQDINLQGIIFNQVLQILLAESVITSVQMDAIASRITTLPSFGTE